MKHIFFLLLAFILASCSFEYPSMSGGDSGLPDITMENLEYVRVRGGVQQAKFKAKKGERYNKRSLMKLDTVEFEQFNRSTGESDASGTSGEVEVELQSGNIRMRGGVSVSIASEDMTLKTETLEWNDADKQLKGGESADVFITRNDGTNFRGNTLIVNTRNRRWEFAKGGEGTYLYDEEDGEAVVEAPFPEDVFIEYDDEYGEDWEPVE